MHIAITNMKRYGVENPFQNEQVKEKIKQTCLERFGKEHPMQNKEIFKKTQQTSFSTKEYIFPSGRKGKTQGYESFAVDLLIKKYNESDIFLSLDDNFPQPIHYYNENDKESVYHPDIYIESENLIIEVKSEYTYNIMKEKNICKKIGCELQEFKFEFWIFDSKGNLTVL